MLAVDAQTTTIGQRIRRLRKLHKISQKALAEQAGISWRGLAELEADKLQGMQTRNLAPLCRALGCSADWLIGLVPDESIDNASE
jgi:transcriptional regulator with XRE-family HTH domain